MCDSHSTKANVADARIYISSYRVLTIYNIWSAPCQLQMIITAHNHATCLHMFLRQPWSDSTHGMFGAAKSGAGPCHCYQVPALASNTLTAVIIA